MFYTLYRRKGLLRKIFFFMLFTATVYVFINSRENSDSPFLNDPEEVNNDDDAIKNGHKAALLDDFNVEDIHVVIAFGRDYLAPAFVALNSLLKNTKYPAHKINVYLIIEDIIASRTEHIARKVFPNARVSVKDKDSLAAEGENEEEEDKIDLIDNIRIDIVIYDASLVPEHKIWVGPRNLDNPLNFVRFELATLLPNLRKIIYIDPDVVVQGDISKLWKSHLVSNKFVIAAVPGSKQETYRKFILDNKEAKLDLSQPYFNAGVMVMNLKIWVMQNKGKEIKKWLDMNLKKPIYKYGSQPPLLLTFYKKYEKINYSWNFRHLGHKMGLSHAHIAKANILHYNGPRKPWRSNFIPEYQKYWLKYYDFDDDVKALLDWGFDAVQDKFSTLLHKKCSTRSKCQEEAQALGHLDRGINMYIDGEPNGVKYKPMLINFLKVFGLRSQKSLVDKNKKYHWDFMWLRKQSDLPKRLLALRFNFLKVNPYNNKVNFMRGFWEESYNKNAHCLHVQKWLEKYSNTEHASGFLPCYVLPDQYNEFKVAQEKTDNVWIGKLFAESSGHGIELYSDFSKVPSPQTSTDKRIIQQYVKRPFLIDKKKTDLRIYVMVTSLDPLRIYVHTSGQVKKAQSEYSYDFTNQYAHISNKVGSAERGYDTNDDELRKQRQIDEFKSRLVVADLPDIVGTEKWVDIWEKTENLLVRSVLTFINKLGCKSPKYSFNCGSAYQLLGVDIVYDENMNPHLMEINNDPGWNPFFEKYNYNKDHPEEGGHDKDPLERCFMEVYGDSLYVTGVLPYNKKFQEAIEKRYDFLCDTAELPQSCEVQEVKQLVVEMANEFANAGGFRLVFPQQNWEDKYEGLYEMPEHIDEHGSLAYDIFTNYFSFELQDQSLYIKKKK